MSRVVALAGNPNVGKTTLFNALTGHRAKVGNYPGITVERRTATIELEGAGIVEVVDIPGTYSLVAHSAEEQIALQAMLGLAGTPAPDVVVFCVDASQLVRGLYLPLQAQEMGIKTVVALTMVDEAGAAAADPRALSKKLGCEVIHVVAPKRQGLDELRRAVVRALQAPPAEPVWRWTPSPDLARRIAEVRAALPSSWPQNDAMALWALMSVDEDDELLGIEDSLRQAVRRSGNNADGANSGDNADNRDNTDNQDNANSGDSAVAAAISDMAPGTNIDDEVIQSRYRWLDEHVAPLMRSQPDRSLTDRVDRILLHRVGGFGIFLAIMFVVFQSLFAWADPAITLVEETFAWIGDQAGSLLPAGVFNDFVVNGLIAGVGSVVVFLPQILLLFFFIGIMEDSGYLARVAYLMDRIMKSMNLHGRAFIPMLSGFACAVPAILATRTMERRRDRLLTMMVVPLMTCSARLPVYTLVIASLYPATKLAGVFPVQGLLMVAMYLFSTITALAAAWVLSRSVKPLKAKRLPFVIELPPYRMPRIVDVLGMMWERTRMFLSEAGTVITVCTIILWALLSFPRSLPSEATNYDALIAAAPTEEVKAELENERQGELLRNSFAGRLGHVIEPVIEPLGFDWKIGVGIIGAFAAREVFVSTMGVVYSTGSDVDENNLTLRQRMRQEVREDGRRVYTPLVGLSLMVFFALACQCVSTLAVVKRETGGYRWPLFLFAYMTALAWMTSFAVYQIGSLLGFG